MFNFDHTVLETGSEQMPLKLEVYSKALATFLAITFYSFRTNGRKRSWISGKGILKLPICSRAGAISTRQ
jgi:hypothetical protein